MQDYRVITDDSVRKGNPIASCRFRFQMFDKEDYPLESEWTQFKSDAIKCAARWLIKDAEKWGNTGEVIKVFNEMNWKLKPTVITLYDAYKIIGNESKNRNTS